MKKTFFTKDPSFYRSFFKLRTVIALQNLVAYSVNMLDNIMLGSYSQNALSGAATVNQIYFIVNQIALAIGNALIAISSQYWGSHQTKPIRKVTKAALLFSLAIAAGIIALCIHIPNTLIGLFTTSPDIIPCGQTDLNIVMDVDTLHHIHVKTCTLDARSHFLNLFHRPDLSRLLVVKCPDKSAHARNLPDHLRCNIIISIAIPSKRHLHPGTSICYANTTRSSTASCPVSAVLLASG